MKKLKCYDVQDVYKKILKKDRVADEKTFSTVVKQYFINMADALFDFSQINLPYGMGVLRCTAVDCSPYYDTKTNTVHGGLKIRSLLKNNSQNKYIKISYYKCRKEYNPFRFCKFVQSFHMRRKKYEIYENNNVNSLFTKQTQ